MNTSALKKIVMVCVAGMAIEMSARPVVDDIVAGVGGAIVAIGGAGLGHYLAQNSDQKVLEERDLLRVRYKEAVDKLDVSEEAKSRLQASAEQLQSELKKVREESEQQKRCVETFNTLGNNDHLPACIDQQLLLLERCSQHTVCNTLLNKWHQTTDQEEKIFLGAQITAHMIGFNIELTKEAKKRAEDERVTQVAVHRVLQAQLDANYLRIVQDQAKATQEHAQAMSLLKQQHEEAAALARTQYEQALEQLKQEHNARMQSEKECREREKKEKEVQDAHMKKFWKDKEKKHEQEQEQLLTKLKVEEKVNQSQQQEIDALAYKLAQFEGTLEALRLQQAPAKPAVTLETNAKPQSHSAGEVTADSEKEKKDNE